MSVLLTHSPRRVAARTQEGGVCPKVMFPAGSRTMPPRGGGLRKTGHGDGAAMLSHSHRKLLIPLFFSFSFLPTSYLCATGLDSKLLCLCILQLGTCEGSPEKGVSQ